MDYPWTGNWPNPLDYTDMCTGQSDNGMSYQWEMQYFGFIGIDPNGDPDGDGLSNLEEYRVGGNPVFTHTFSSGSDDGQYLHAALGVPKPPQGQVCQACQEKAHLLISWPGGSSVRLDIENANPYAVYDLYFLADFDPAIYQAPWRCLWPGVQCDSQGSATLLIEEPTWPAGYFLILDAADDDVDGLSNGYECWFKYPTGLKTCAQNSDSDGDMLPDGWEVEYGLDPTDNGSVDPRNGYGGDPDGDGLSNYSEFLEYSTTDNPHDPYGTFQNRPIVTVQANPATCGLGSFTIRRAGSTAASLRVYYALGGSLGYLADYNLEPLPQAPPGDPDPDGYPRIFLADIPARSDSVTVNVTLVGDPVASGRDRLAIMLVPYQVGIQEPLPAPAAPDWQYVVDLFALQDRASITFPSDPPIAGCVGAFQDVVTQPGVPVTFNIAASDPCGRSLTYNIVTPPQHGTLVAFDPATGSVTYQPGQGYTGSDFLDYTVRNSVGTSPNTVQIYTVPLPTLVTSCRPDSILLHWSAPEPTPGFYQDFQIYRCDVASGSCTPTELLATVPGNQRTYVDSNNLQSGRTYCYTVTFRHAILCPASSPPYESPPSNQTCNQLCPAPTDVLITGHGADIGDGTGPIETYHFADGSQTASFVPEHYVNGRGLALHGGEIFYTDDPVFAPPDPDIHVCPYGTQGSGGTTDTRTLANAWRPGVESAALDFHNDGVHGDVLYVLTGYNLGPSDADPTLKVFGIDPAWGTTLVGPVQIAGASLQSDGFVVLPWGNFLINDGDGDAPGGTSYHEYDRATGAQVANGLAIDLASFGFVAGTGVALAPDGQSLYFAADIGQPFSQTIVQIDLAGNLMSFQPISSRRLEDIHVAAP